MDADETGKVLEALLDGGNDVLRYLWMSCADPMACPLKPRPWLEIVPGSTRRTRSGNPVADDRNPAMVGELTTGSV